MNKDDKLYMKLTEEFERDAHDCRYASNNKERFCNATSHESCDGCRFFVPTSQAKLKLFTERIEHLIKMRSKLIDENKRLHETISIERMNNRKMEEENRILQKRNEKLERMPRGMK